MPARRHRGSWLFLCSDECGARPRAVTFTLLCSKKQVKRTCILTAERLCRRSDLLETVVKENEYESNPDASIDLRRRRDNHRNHHSLRQHLGFAMPYMHPVHVARMASETPTSLVFFEAHHPARATDQTDIDRRRTSEANLEQLAMRPEMALQILVAQDLV